MKINFKIIVTAILAIFVGLGAGYLIFGDNVNNILIDGFNIQGADPNGTANGLFGTGQSSYAIVLISCNNVDIKNCTITSGNGASGIDGDNGSLQWYDRISI